LWPVSYKKTFYSRLAGCAHHAYSWFSCLRYTRLLMYATQKINLNMLKNVFLLIGQKISYHYHFYIYMNTNNIYNHWSVCCCWLNHIVQLQLAYYALKISLRSKVKMLQDIFIDTTGYAFTYIIAHLLFGCSQVIAYVQYPTMSTDMLKLVLERRRSSYNHSQYISRSRIISCLKLVYYIKFVILYGIVGSFATIVVFNSLWTYNHIHFIWKYAASANEFVLYIHHVKCQTC